MDPGDLRTSESLRGQSKQAFGSSFRIEVALTLLDLPATFVFDELYERLRRLAADSGIKPPSPAKVRVELARLRDPYGAVEREDAKTGELLRREVRNDDSSLYALCEEIYVRHSA